MTTYNTYQEAQIANPEYAIFEYQRNFGTDKEILDLFDIQSREMKECKPADHCMTVEKFLADGHKFVDGDAYLETDGDMYDVEINFVDMMNETHELDCHRYILRAAALEKIPTETPEEKEVLDGIESAGCVEWNGDGLPPVGVECEALDFDDDTWRLVKVLDAKTSSKEVAVTTISNIGIFGKLFWATNFRKPETPQQREDRERLEAAYDLYCDYCKIINFTGVDFDLFSKSLNGKDAWLAIVDKTNYRKEKTNGTN